VKGGGGDSAKAINSIRPGGETTPPALGGKRVSVLNRRNIEVV